MQKIPRLVIAATQSGSGKTTIVTGLLKALQQAGLKVQSFKVGPDYIDPGYHQLASGRPAHNLDSWLVPAEKLPEIMAKEATGADIVIIEGVMGLFDGGRQGVSSTASIAKLLQAPVLLVIDAKSMGASAAAIALGFAKYDDDLPLAGVILNRLGSASHEQMIREAMQALGIKVYGAVHRNENFKLPERHLGLLPVQENSADMAVVAELGQKLTGQLEVAEIIKLANQAPPLNITEKVTKPSINKVKIGIARDAAFSFYYQTSLQELINLGAELVEFSPLHDKELPDVDGIIIGGGFPEMFAKQLSENVSMRKAIFAKAHAGMPIYAECGGYMYLLKSLTDFANSTYPMVGVFSGAATMTTKLQMVGYVTAKLQNDNILGQAGTLLPGHEFHFSIETDVNKDDKAITRPFEFTRLRNGQKYLAGQQYKRVLGSYLHLHFAGCPQAAAEYITNCVAYQQEKEGVQDD